MRKCEQAICTLITPLKNTLIKQLLAPEVKTLWFVSEVSHNLPSCKAVMVISRAQPVKASAPFSDPRYVKPADEKSPRQSQFARDDSCLCV